MPQSCIMKILLLSFLILWYVPIFSVGATYNNTNSYQNTQNIQDSNVTNGTQPNQSPNIQNSNVMNDSQFQNSQSAQNQSENIVNKERIHDIVDDILGINYDDNDGIRNSGDNTVSRHNANVQELVDDIKQALNKFSTGDTRSTKYSGSAHKKSQQSYSGSQSQNSSKATRHEKKKWHSSRKRKIYTVKNVAITAYNTKHATKNAYSIKNYGAKDINMHKNKTKHPIKYEIKTYDGSQGANIFANSENVESTKKFTVKKRIDKLTQKTLHEANYFRPGKCCGG